MKEVPIFWVEKGKLRIPCTVPTLDEVERILNTAERIASAETAGGKLTIAQAAEIYEFAASILSNNQDFVAYTVDDLKDNGFTVAYIYEMIASWTDFVGSLAKIKN